MKYLFNHLKSIQNKIQNNAVLLLLDYDGTLTPIVKRPSLAKLNSKTKSLLKKLSSLKEVELGIISGRALLDVKGLVALNGIYYAGNHGFEINGPGLKFKNPAPKIQIKALKEIGKRIKKALSDYTGVLIENKKLSLSIHYRLIKPQLTPQLLKIIKDVCQNRLKRKHIKISLGKKVIEIKPAFKWNKGKAVNWLAKNSKLKKPFIPVYMGDDITDNDAFLALKKRGITVLVGEPSQKFSSEYFVKKPSEAKKFFNLIYKLKR